MATPNFINILFRDSTNVIIQTTDEFLATFPVGYFQNRELIQGLINLLNSPSAKRIGEPSAIGMVFEVTDGGQTFIIKVSPYCPANVAPATKPLLAKLCKMANTGDLIFRIPDTQVNKTTVFAPNYLIEPLIGIILYNATRKFTPSFMNVVGFQYDSTDPQKITYTVTEKLIPINEYITTEFKFIYFIFQMTYALDVAQKLGRFVHYDLHKDNIMGRPKQQDLVTIYPLQNGKYMYTLFDFDSVLIDYGHSRYETQNTILAPRLIFSAPGEREQLDYYFYNPYYDLFSLLYTNFLKIQARGFPKWNTEKDVAIGTEIINILFRQFTNLPPDKSMVKLINHLLINPNSWRPWPERLATEYSGMDWYRVSTPTEFLINIGEYIQTFIDRHETGLRGKEKAIAFLSKYGLYITDQIYDLAGYSQIREYHVYNNVAKKEQMDTTYYNYRFLHESQDQFDNVSQDQFDNVSIKTITEMPHGVRLNREPFNHIIPESVIKFGDYRQQFIHVATIDQMAGKSLGYEFNFDCCRVDLRNYFQREDIMAGIAVNASFFDRGGNYMPVGYFKTRDFFNDGKNPPFYEQIYGIVAIKKDGTLILDTFENRLQYDDVLTSGPVLVAHGKIIITKDELQNRVHDNKRVWQCRNPTVEGETVQKVFNDGIFNCNAVQPGELSHGSNPNPRMAIAIDAQWRIFFIYVEGRDSRGAGMDLAQLAQLCANLGAVDAINLDGGLSSQFVWKRPDERVIYQLNPAQSITYPVGSIISYIKKKPL